jgi:hypothetical protein
MLNQGQTIFALIKVAAIFQIVVVSLHYLFTKLSALLRLSFAISRVPRSIQSKNASSIFAI